MAVHGRVLFGSGERVDLADFLSIDSFTAGDFKYLVSTLTGSSTPFVLKGLDVISPQTAIGAQQISITVADAALYYPTSTAGSFFMGLPEGNALSTPISPELRRNATNFVYAMLSTESGTQDTRAFWDPDQNDNVGREYVQDVNTQTILKIEVGVSVFGFPTGSLPICKVIFSPTAITSIQDCRPLFFRLGSGGAFPDPFAGYDFRDLPDAGHAREEPPDTITTAVDPNPFQGGDKNIYTLKEWMDALMTRVREISGTTYWYQSTNTPSIPNLFMDSLASTLKSKGEWEHDVANAGTVTWTADLINYSLVDPRAFFVRAGSVHLDDDQIAYIKMVRDSDANLIGSNATWQVGASIVNGTPGTFTLVKKGDYIKRKADTTDRYVRVEQFYAGLNLTGGVTTPDLAQSIKLEKPYAGTTSVAFPTFTRGEYEDTDITILDRGDTAVTADRESFFWLLSRNDTVTGITSVATTVLTLDLVGDGSICQATETVLAGHGLQDGDRVTVGAGAYAGTYAVEVTSATKFTFSSTGTTSESGVAARYAVVTTEARYTTEGYLLESAEHSALSGHVVHIEDTATALDGSYIANVRSATTLQIAVPATIPDPASGFLRVPKMSVRTEFGSVKIVQGESIEVGDTDTTNILRFTGMRSLAETHPQYEIGSFNALHGQQNFNCDETDNLTERVSKLTAMMADRAQDRSLQIAGVSFIHTHTDGTDVEVTFSADLSVVKHKSPTQTILLSGTTHVLAENTALVVTIDRNGSANIAPVIESLGNPFMIAENKLVIVYRLGDEQIHAWTGATVPANGGLTVGCAEDASTKNIIVVRKCELYHDSLTDLVTFGGGAEEQTRIEVLDGASITQSSYFTINSALDATEYYVWYNIDSLGTNPAIVGKTGIEVAILSTDSAIDVADATAAAIDLFADFSAIAVSDIVIVTNNDPGETTDAADGLVPTGFAFLISIGGASRLIEIKIPGSAFTNYIDTVAINTLGTFVLARDKCAWVRIDRNAQKVFNTVSTVSAPDTTLAGTLFVTDLADVPADTETFVLWQNVNNVLEEQHAAVEVGDAVYFESYDVVASPVGDYEILGPIPPNTQIQLPKNAKRSGSYQTYIVGTDMLEIYLNGIPQIRGRQWHEVGTAGSASAFIEMDLTLNIEDVLTFRIVGKGSVYFSSNSISSITNTLQSAYLNGNTIDILSGRPVTIDGPAGEPGLVVTIDARVDGEMFAGVSVPSDRRMKEVIGEIDTASALDTINELTPTYFRWKDAKRSARLHAGLIAQDVEVVMPDACTHVPDKDLGTMLTYSPTDVVAYLIGAVKEMTQRYEQAAKRIEVLEQKIADLEQE